MRNNIVTILICENVVRQGEIVQKIVPAKWEQATGASCHVDICTEIVGTKANPGQKTVADVGGKYDLLILDIYWPIDGATDEKPRGINMCQMVRDKFPELPIIVMSEQVKITDFEHLIPLRIDGFVTKKDPSLVPLVGTIRSVLEKAESDGRGRPLFQQLRGVLATPAAWRPIDIGLAASDFWKQDSARGKWGAFWRCLDAHLTETKVKLVFDGMKALFRDTDLFNLGVMTEMRGHLEHVIYVYFTGYVLAHQIPDFRLTVLEGFKRFLGPDYRMEDEEKYWDAFHLAWLACATLHDTGYCLEVLPDAVEKMRGIGGHFSFAELDGVIGVVNASGFKSSDAGLRTAWSDILSTADILYGDTRRMWIQEHAIFKKEGKNRFNHGVMSAVRFLIEYHKVEPSAKLAPAQKVAFRWASLAMAMHSLKVPGREEGVAIIYKDDPLSFLLLLCDEIQVWNRERPDLALEKSYFRSCELSSLTCDGTNIHAAMTYVESSRFEGSKEEAIETTRTRILKDQATLSSYLKSAPLSIVIEFKTRANEDMLGSIDLK